MRSLIGSDKDGSHTTKEDSLCGSLMHLHSFALHLTRFPCFILFFSCRASIKEVNEILITIHDPSTNFAIVFEGVGIYPLPGSYHFHGAFCHSPLFFSLFLFKYRRLQKNIVVSAVTLGNF
jgi:hypothetical protein